MTLTSAGAGRVFAACERSVLSRAAEVIEMKPFDACCAKAKNAIGEVAGTRVKSTIRVSHINGVLLSQVHARRVDMAPRWLASLPRVVVGV